MDENRLALISIIVDDPEAVSGVNSLLHEAADFIVGRMGLPYRKRGVNVISVVLDAPPPAVNALSGKLGMIKGVTAKAVYSTK